MIDKDELKSMLGDEAERIIMSLYGMRKRGQKVSCPFHIDKDPSMSFNKQTNSFKCFSCGETIDIYSCLMDKKGMNFKEAMEEVARMVGVNLDDKNKKIEPKRKIETKEFLKPRIKMNELSEEAIKQMEDRGIKKKTLDELKVKERIWNNKKVYVFQYFNEENELEYVSYRGIGVKLKGGCEPNTKAILWGIDHVDTTKPLVICEGQPDAMAIYQSGYKNVVSVPAGSNNLNWINYCWEWLNKIDEIIVWADNDAPGTKMAEEIKTRLKNVKVISHKYKDANEVLINCGSEEVYKFIEKAIKQTPQGIIDASQMEYKSYIGQEQYTIETGFYEYDSHVEDWKPEELTVIFGRNGEGKTTFISQIIAHNIYKRVPVFLYSGEMSNQKIQDWLYRQIVGKDEKYYRKIECKYRVKSELKPEVVELLKKWHKDKLFIFDRECDKTANDLGKFFDIMDLAAKKYGVKLFVIDNLMSRLEENADSLNSDQANFVQRCKDFAIRNKVHVVLLAHPNKEKREITEANPEGGNLAKTDISGSNNIANKADNIIAVERVWNDNTDSFGRNLRTADAIITSLKDRESGERKAMFFRFSKNTLRFYNEHTKETFDYMWAKKDEVEKIEEIYYTDDGELMPF